MYISILRFCKKLICKQAYIDHAHIDFRLYILNIYLYEH
jgi:hypothetical protein